MLDFLNVSLTDLSLWQTLTLGIVWMVCTATLVLIAVNIMATSKNRILEAQILS